MRVLSRLRKDIGRPTNKASEIGDTWQMAGNFVIDNY